MRTSAVLTLSTELYRSPLELKSIPMSGSPLRRRRRNAITVPGETTGAILVKRATALMRRSSETTVLASTSSEWKSSVKTSLVCGNIKAMLPFASASEERQTDLRTSQKRLLHFGDQADRRNDVENAAAVMRHFAHDRAHLQALHGAQRP